MAVPCSGARITAGIPASQYGGDIFSWVQAFQTDIPSVAGSTVKGSWKSSNTGGDTYWRSDMDDDDYHVEITRASIGVILLTSAGNSVDRRTSVAPLSPRTTKQGPPESHG
jgi:hypothetical protein